MPQTKFIVTTPFLEIDGVEVAVYADPSEKLSSPLRLVEIRTRAFFPSAVPNVEFFPHTVFSLHPHHKKFMQVPTKGECSFSILSKGFYRMARHLAYKFPSSQFWVSWDGVALTLLDIELV